MGVQGKESFQANILKTIDFLLKNRLASIYFFFLWEVHLNFLPCLSSLIVTFCALSTTKTEVIKLRYNLQPISKKKKKEDTIYNLITRLLLHEESNWGRVENHNHSKESLEIRIYLDCMSRYKSITLGKLVLHHEFMDIYRPREVKTNQNYFLYSSRK